MKDALERLESAKSRWSLLNVHQPIRLMIESGIMHGMMGDLAVSLTLFQSLWQKIISDGGRSFMDLFGIEGEGFELVPLVGACYIGLVSMATSGLSHEPPPVQDMPGLGRQIVAEINKHFDKKVCFHC